MGQDVSVDFEMYNGCFSIGTVGAWRLAWLSVSVHGRKELDHLKISRI